MRVGPRAPTALSALLLATVAGCVARSPEARPEPGPISEPTPAVESNAPDEPGAGRAPAPRYPDGHSIEYRATCSLRNECRITYRDDEGQLHTEVAVGDWSRVFRAPRGARLWVRAATGGCATTQAKATILVDGKLLAEESGASDPAISCQWITAVAELDLP